MSDELKSVSQGFDLEVMKYEKYDVNGFCFHIETHQNSRENPKTINSRVFCTGLDRYDYYGRLQSVYDWPYIVGMYNSTSLCSSVIGSTQWVDREIPSPL